MKKGDIDIKGSRLGGVDSDWLGVVCGDGVVNFCLVHQVVYRSRAEPLNQSNWLPQIQYQTIFRKSDLCTRFWWLRYRLAHSVPPIRSSGCSGCTCATGC